MVGPFDSLRKPLLVSEREKLPIDKAGLPLSQAEIFFTDGDPETALQPLTIQLSNGLGEAFRISISPGQMTADRTKSGKIDFSDKFPSVQTMPLFEKITDVRIIIDSSSVEILLNGGKYAMTNQVFPNEEYSALIIKGEGVPELKNFQINSISRTWD